ncbi:carbohydrate ABC transporter permease [Flexivirga sp. ID2601S]|uniref:Carbohydrate ABC transporter permease n=1 Tax=Flexivirga aerilata TaxID=1656889 RepID=A0A849AIB2_9MICO|nr:carbohydrate ABC transporter permease [Flexivirga aerilata]NNG39587.1 carbohydrate ABC transporter permease [Flexivirga aerilata]
MPVETTDVTRTVDAPPRTPPRPVRRRRPRAGHLARAVIAWAVALITVFPLVWLLLTAFKPEGESFSGGLPSRWTFDNLTFVLTEVPFPRYLLNSAIVSVVVTALALLFHSMAAYALSRLRFRGSGLVLSAMVSTMLVSLPVILVPLFLIAKALGLLDNFAGLIVPMIFNAFGIFLLRQYYLNFPTELEDAAQLDGCGYPRLFWHVVLPLSRPALASLSVLFFLANWNAFLWPLVITSNPDLAVVQVGMSSLQGQYASAYNYVLAGSLIAVIPTILVFLLGQRWLIESMKSSGLK